MYENYLFYGCLVIIIIIIIKHIITPKKNISFKNNKRFNLKKDLFSKTNHLVRYLV